MRQMADTTRGANAAAAAAAAAAAWSELVGLAAAQLRAGGWRVEAMREEKLASWHLVARRGAKWCVVQILAPGTLAAARQTRRRELGETVRLAPRLGTMEQWGAHVRPGGRVMFGMETLSGTAWMGLPNEEELAERLGLASVQRGVAGDSVALRSP